MKFLEELGINWISVKDRHAPSMETVLLSDGKNVSIGWNESVQPEESAAYCRWMGNPEVDLENITHWMPLPEPPK